MTSQITAQLQARTDAKIRYARIHVDELRPLRPLGSDDFGRTHQESFLFHLFGARDAFVDELNHYYGAQLPLEDLAAGKLRKALQARGLKSAELARLYELERMKNRGFRG